MEFWAELVLVQVSAVFIGLVQVLLFHCAWSVSANSLVCNIGNEGSHPCDICEPQPGVFLSHPSPFNDQKTQLPTSSLDRLHGEVY